MLHQRTSMAQGHFFRWVRLQGLSPHVSVLKMPWAPSAFPFSGCFRCLTLLRRVKAWGMAPWGQRYNQWWDTPERTVQHAPQPAKAHPTNWTKCTARKKHAKVSLCWLTNIGMAMCMQYYWRGYNLEEFFFHFIRDQISMCSLIRWYRFIYMFMSFSVDVILQLRYMNWSTNFRGLPLNERVPSCLKHMNSLFCEFT